MFPHFFIPFQAFQRQVHERLTQLELVNKQYRRLARENRTDAASKLKVMVHEGNQRWDSLQRRVAAVLRRLKVRLVFLCVQHCTFKRHVYYNITL